MKHKARKAVLFHIKIVSGENKRKKNFEIIPKSNDTKQENNIGDAHTPQPGEIVFNTM